jgi:hypothetical protein
MQLNYLMGRWLGMTLLFPSWSSKVSATEYFEIIRRQRTDFAEVAAPSGRKKTAGLKGERFG